MVLSRPSKISITRPIAESFVWSSRHLTAYTIPKPVSGWDTFDSAEIASRAVAYISTTGQVFSPLTSGLLAM